MRPYRTIQFDREGPVAWILLDRPEVLNAYNMEMRDDMYAALTTARDDPSIRVVVLRGNGRAFCSGGDLREFGSAPSAVGAREVRLRRDVWALLHALEQPTIAAVHGHAAGSGLEMAMLCDFRIAARGTRFSLPETSLAMIPGVVGTQTAPRVLGVGRALDFVLRGTTIDAREAQRIGLVGSVVTPAGLVDAARRLALRLANVEENRASRVKRLVVRGLDMTLEQGLAWERRLSGRTEG
jgi:enoyl-CoA hydratase/carnithine racemase